MIECPVSIMRSVALPVILVAILGWAHPIQAHGGHVPMNLEFLHGMWHMFAAAGMVAVFLLWGVFFWGLPNSRVRNKGKWDRSRNLRKFEANSELSDEDFRKF